MNSRKIKRLNGERYVISEHDFGRHPDIAKDFPQTIQKYSRHWERTARAVHNGCFITYWILRFREPTKEFLASLIPIHNQLRIL